jgi:tripeptide aminopeptidase
VTAPQAVLSLIVRDFEEDGLAVKEAMLETLVKDVMANYAGATYTFEVKQQYRNMKVVLDEHPEVVENALEAIRRAGMQPVCSRCAAAFEAARTDRGFPSWACPAPTSSRAAMRFTRPLNG